MLLSKAEMTALRVVGMFADTPAEMLRAVDWGNVFSEMLERGYLKFNREKTSLRLTETGVEILSEAGVYVKAGTRATGRILVRRFQASQVALLIGGLGIDEINVPKIFDTLGITKSIDLDSQPFICEDGNGVIAKRKRRNSGLE